MPPSHLDFQSPTPEERRLPPAQFTASQPTVAPLVYAQRGFEEGTLENIDPSKTTNIGRSLNQAQQDKLIKFLIDNRNIFAWTPLDMPGIPREIAEHSLRIRADTKPVKQRLRQFDDERRKAIEEEIAKLLDADFIREVLHPDWLANPVLVPKKNNKLRMCVDYIYMSLNKACPMDPYP
jgi:hypothetical protein